MSDLGRSDGRTVNLRKTYMCSICLPAERSSSCSPCRCLTYSLEQLLTWILQANPFIHDVNQHRRMAFQPAKLVHKVTGRMPDKHKSSGWWSQTGSNRRPEACKATALPTELWPRPSPNQETGPKPNQSWWAWEDLNFRPHAYQARALTN